MSSAYTITLFLARVSTQTGALCLLWRTLNRAYILFIGTRSLSQKYGAATGAARFRGVGVAAFAVPIFGNFTLAGVSYQARNRDIWVTLFSFTFDDDEISKINKEINVFLKSDRLEITAADIFLATPCDKKKKKKTRRGERLPSNFRHLETPALNADFF